MKIDSIVEVTQAMSKEQRLDYFFKLIKLPGSDIPYIDSIYQALNISGSDVRTYQLQKEAEVSLKPSQKQQIVIKKVVKPLMKSSGFKYIQGTWYKKIGDGIIIVHLQKSRFNGFAGGANFWFAVSASWNNEVRNRIENQWIYNQMNTLKESDFLPYWGFLMPYHSSLGYQIDGYQNFLPLDQSIEDIVSQTTYEFENFIIPGLGKLETMEDWNSLYEEKIRCRETKEYRLLCYYSSACQSAPIESNFKQMAFTQEQFNLMDEEICAHLDWLDLLMMKSASPQKDVKQFVLKALQFRRGMVKEDGRNGDMPGEE